MKLKLYHGSKSNHQFKGDLAMTFLTTDLKFTNNNEYGGADGFKYEVVVEVNNCFDSTNLGHIKNLYKAGFKLSDPYLHIEDEPEFSFDDDYLNEGVIIEEFGDMDFYKTAEDFCKSKTAQHSTWEAIEESPGVMDWIKKNFDSVLILEAGFKNFIIFNTQNIKTVKLINKK